MSEKLKIAIIGGGWFGSFHLEMLLSIDTVEVIAVCSRTENSAKRLQEKVPQATIYTNYIELFNNESTLQAIIVCVPPDQHNGIELEAAKRSIHMYIEKPLCVSLSEALSYEKAINESGIICSVGYQNLYNPLLDEVKEFLSDKKIGYIHGCWIGNMPGPAWWRRKEGSGGQLHEQATHLINVLIYLFGDISSVFSKATTIVTQEIENCDVEQASSSIFTFHNNIVANVSCGCFVNEEEGKKEISITFFTDKGIINYGWDRNTVFANAKESLIKEYKGSYHRESIQGFIDAVMTNDKSKIRCDYSFAIKTFLATHAANKSMLSGKEEYLSAR